MIIFNELGFTEETSSVFKAEKKTAANQTLVDVNRRIVKSIR